MNYSEYHSKPSKIIIHNPALTNSLNFISEKNREGFLFLGNPDIEVFKNDYQTFKKAVSLNGTEVIELTDIIKKSKEMYQLLHLINVNPNQIYTRDAMITIPWLPGKCIIGRMREPIRRIESIVMREVANIFGLEVISFTPTDLFIEGGDVIPIILDGKRFLLVGYERRTSESAIHFLKKQLMPKDLDGIIGIKLADWRINLDGGCVPINESTIVAHPESLLSAFIVTAKGEEKIDPLLFFEKNGFSIITVSKEESIFKQACNILCLGDNNLVMYDHSLEILKNSNEIDSFKTVSVSSRELAKGRGGPRCMSRPIY
ncbi:MAG: arginine deiminase family protein [Pseudomonadota bacterium]